MVTRTVQTYSATELETAVVVAGGAAAAMRSIEEWEAHPQGRAVASEPLVAWSVASDASATQERPTIDRPRRERPLAGVRVLDLTRVLAGPVATRFLAGLGADVLRIDPPTWDEPGVVPDVTLGKRCARLDLRRPADVDQFVTLLASADVLVHGYRPGALAGLGFDHARLHAVRPGLVDVALDAYGWSGPWAGRRGFDSLVQMSSGIADAGRRVAGAERPTPLPVQALDHATGYLMAAAALRGLTVRRRDMTGSSARVSLARTARARRCLHDRAGHRDRGYGPARCARLRAGRRDDTVGTGSAVAPALSNRRCAHPSGIDRPPTSGRTRLGGPEIW